MLDIRFIRENADQVTQKSQQKGYTVDIQKLLAVDDSRRKLLSEIERVRAERNQLADKTKSGQPSPEDMEQGRKLKETLAQLENQLGPVNDEYDKLLKEIPNMPADDVPVGASEDENKVAKEWGEKPQFDFTPKTHWQIAEERGLIDKERAAKVSGSRFAYIKGDLVRLQLAIVNFVIDTLTNEEKLRNIAEKSGIKNVSPKPFVPVLPPLMIIT
jgi:seryl-tRNA synthetase